MTTIVINETIPAFRLDIGADNLSLREVFEKALSKAQEEEYQFTSALKTIFDQVESGSRDALVDGFVTRLGAEKAVSNGSQITTQGKGDQGTH